MGQTGRKSDHRTVKRGEIMSKSINLEVPKHVQNAAKDKTFRIIVNETQESVEIFLTGVVGDEYTESDASSISKILSANRGKPVTMRVNSPGGLAFDGLAIHNALAAHDGPTTGIIEGLAASAASLAVIGCDTVKCYANAMYQIHEGISFAFGHIADLQDTIEWLQAFNAAAVDTYAAKTGKSQEYIAAAMLGDKGDGTKYTAAEAMEIGFIDEIIPLNSKRKSTAAKNENDKQRLSAKVKRSAVQHRLNVLESQHEESLRKLKMLH